MTASLRELERQLRSTFGAWNHYRLRVWQECRSFDAAGVEDRIRVANEVLADLIAANWYGHGAASLCCSAKSDRS